MEKVYKLSDYGKTLGPRFLGQKLCIDAEKFLRESDSNNVTFDLVGIKSLSSGFCFDLFGKLYDLFSLQFNNKVKIIFSEDKESNFLKIIIKNSIWQYQEIKKNITRN